MRAGVPDIEKSSVRPQYPQEFLNRLYVIKKNFKADHICHHTVLQLRFDIVKLLNEYKERNELPPYVQMNAYFGENRFSVDIGHPRDIDASFHKISMIFYGDDAWHMRDDEHDAKYILNFNEIMNAEDLKHQNYE